MYVPIRSRTKAVFIWTTLSILLLTFLSQVPAEDLVIDVVNAARCQVRCLSLLQGRQPLPVAGRMSGNATSLASCQQDTSCADCSKPCEVKQRQRHCDDVCSSPTSASSPVASAVVVMQSLGDDGASCRESCRFLQRVNAIRPGTCPPETHATGFAALCIRNCDNDAECDGGATSSDAVSTSGVPGVEGAVPGAATSTSTVPLKCCSNGCGWTCQRPTHIYEGVPSLVEITQVLERKSIDGVDLAWRSQSANASGTLLYLVGLRSSVGRQFVDVEASPWQIVTQTMSSHATLERLKPAHWYQFRVAAVNIYGSRGWSSPSLSFKLHRDPIRPEPPFNLTEGDTQVVDGRVAVNVHWSEPKNADLPISRYKIYWSKRLKSVSPQLQSLQEMRRVISGDQRSFQLTDLDPDTTYYIQVQAVVQYGDIRLKSDKASVFIVTHASSRLRDQDVLIPTVAIVTSGAFPTPVSPENIKLERIYFQNGLLRANITWSFEEVEDKDERCDKVLLYWSPEVCASEAGVDDPAVPVMSATTHDNHFVVYDLRFACRYLIRLQPVSVHRVTGEMAYISLSTPFCWQATVVGGIRPDCPRNAARLPEEPVELSHTLMVGHSDITAKLSWKEPHVPAADPPITGYQVVWGPVLPASHHLLMDKEASESRDLPKDMLSLVVSLDEDSTYAVYVRAMSRYGLGRIASIRLATPRLEVPTPANPPYFDVATQSVLLPTNSPAELSPTPTPYYIFVGYSPPKRDPNRSIGQQQNAVVVAAATPHRISSVSSASRLPHQLSFRTLSYGLFFAVALLLSC